MSPALFKLDPLLCGIYAVISVITFVVYWFDKHAAMQGQRRVSETTLHGLALLGGWPGAYVAQKVLRHKTVKQPFQLIFLVCVVLNTFGFVIYSSPRTIAGILSIVGQA